MSNRLYYLVFAFCFCWSLRASNIETKSQRYFLCSDSQLVEIKKAFETAISFYPEVKLSQVHFRFRKAKYPYASRPTFWSFFRRKKRRKYCITISLKSNSLREPTLMHNLNFEEKIGAFGHELAHIAQYSCQSNLSILVGGLRYLFFKHKKRMEHLTDKVAVEHGIGDYLLAWSEAVYPIKLKDGRRSEIYLSPEEIKGFLQTE